MYDDPEHRDVVVIGAGQAGLAIGRLLAAEGLDFIILDAGDRVGDAWRRRYSGLTLFTPRRFSALAGMALTGNPEDYPSKDEFADYLEGFSLHFGLPVKCGARVTSVGRDGAGLFKIAGDGFDPILARAVIMALGGFRNPMIPRWGEHLIDIFNVAAEGFTGGAMPDGPLLVVGDGASGRDIAMSEAGRRQVVLATGRFRRLLPERILGQSLWFWLDVTGLLGARPDSMLGGFMKRTDPFPDRNRNLRALEAAGVEIRGRAVGHTDGRVIFDDGTTFSPAGIVWAQGYRPDWSFLEMWEAFDHQGRLVQKNGVSSVAGLYFLGLPWQRNRASALVMGASADAAALLPHVRQHVRTNVSDIQISSKFALD